MDSVALGFIREVFHTNNKIVKIMYKIGNLVKLRTGKLAVGATVHIERNGLVCLSYQRIFVQDEIGLYLGEVNVAEYKSENPGPWLDIVLVGEEKLHVPQGVLVRAEDFGVV